jgi:hypothetical protein
MLGLNIGEMAERLEVETRWREAFQRRSAAARVGAEKIFSKKLFVAHLWKGVI